jgi:8-oxo-dGTP diphosphatase
MQTSVTPSAIDSPKPRIGVGVLIINEGKILLGKRKGLHAGGCFGPPGGHLEFLETLEACAAREALEETGLKLLSVQIGPWTQDFIDDRKHYISFFGIATEFEGQPQLLEPEKCEGWDWYPWNNLPAPLFMPLVTLIDSFGLDHLKEITRHATLV